MAFVWFATEERVQSTKKTLVYDDTGDLQVSPQGLVFTGTTRTVHIPEARSVTLARQRIPWRNYVVLNLPLVVLLVLALVALSVRPFPLLYLFAALLGAAWVLGTGIGLFVALNTSWVEVEYLDENQSVRRAYFADGEQSGWSGILGGTKRMCVTLEAWRVAR